MGTHNISISDDLWAVLEAKSQAEGKAIEALAEEVLRKGLDDSAWRELLAYGAGRGRVAGFTESQSAEVVHRWRLRKMAGAGSWAPAENHHTAELHIGSTVKFPTS